jgi:arylsulfatase A-like enzyme
LAGSRARSARRWVLAVAVVLVLALSGCTKSASIGSLPSPGRSGAPASPSRPNIVFVLTDDLSWNLVRYMPHVLAMEQTGMTFTNYTVTDSLCCPSRASILTGRFPHDTHIVTNTMPDGGFIKFRNLHEDRSTFNVSLLNAGYRTAFMGKYLNGYSPQSSALHASQAGTAPYVPLGWSVWDGVGAGGYRGFDYSIADGHQVVNYQRNPQQYITTVLDRKANAFVQQAVTKPNPFLLEVATFAPHKPYTPAPADVGTFTGLPAPHTPAFDRLPSPAPAWLKGHHPLQNWELRNIEHSWQLRVEAVQAVDRMIGALQRTVARAGQTKNTVFVFSSDNGYHLGEYTLQYGKQTAFDTDIRVPLIISGPGVRANSTNADPTENIDLRPTFEQLGGAPTPPTVEGRSLVPLLHGLPEPWRQFALIEHHHPTNTPTDPDAQNIYSGNPPSYTAIRSTRFLYVRYITGDREYYDLSHDPFELHNLGPTLSKARITALDLILNRLTNCHSSTSCWRAAIPANA